jgi:hypothetical protein
MKRQYALLPLLMTWGCTIAQPQGALSASNPTAGDIAVLQRATKECHLHEGALSFVRRAVPIEPLIRMTTTFGDTEQQLDCALKYFPEDFDRRFGLEFTVKAPR